MRFVSQDGYLHLGSFRKAEEFISPARKVIVDGREREVHSERYTVTPAIPIQFDHNSCLNSDIKAAKDYWKRWPGLPLEEDGVTPCDPFEVGRIGVWDSEQWQKDYELSDDDRLEAEQKLLKNPGNRTLFFQVEAPIVVGPAAPWSTYDKTHHAKIAKLALELGVVGEALAYEESTKNRSSVISELETALGSIETPQGDVVTA